MTGEQFDQEAQRIDALLAKGPRIVVIGSSDFWHVDSESTCIHIGRLLAEVKDLVLLTGGVEGIGEATARSFFQTRQESGLEARVYHILPVGEEPWDYGETLFAGSDMRERREVLGRLAQLYLMVEGGPGTVHEAEVACSRNATIIPVGRSGIPVGRSGGHAAVFYSRTERPSAVDEQTWSVLGAYKTTPEEAAMAAVRAIQSCLEMSQ